MTEEHPPTGTRIDGSELRKLVEEWRERTEPGGPYDGFPGEEHVANELADELQAVLDDE